MGVHVICCNDSVVSAHIGEELREADFRKHRSIFTDLSVYKNSFFWHPHSVEGTS